LQWALTPETAATIRRLKLLQGEASLARPEGAAYAERWMSGLELRYHLKANQVVAAAYSDYATHMLHHLERHPLPALPTSNAFDGPSALVLLGRNHPESFVWVQLPGDRQRALLDQPRFLQELAFVLSPTPIAVRPARATPRVLFRAATQRPFTSMPLQPHPMSSLLDLPGLAALTTLLQDVGETLYHDAEPVEATLASLHLELVRARHTAAAALLRAWKGAA
jgi:hypothetical protein